MQPFWREEPLNDTEQRLFMALQQAHHRAAMRPNGSSMAVVQVAEGSGDYMKAIAAALLTVGEAHGPIEKAYRFLKSEVITSSVLLNGGKIPGWGSSFPPDPTFDEPWYAVAREIAQINPELCDEIENITKHLSRAKEVTLLPNPACWTAAAAITLGVPERVSPFFFIAGRISAWTEIFLRVQTKPVFNGHLD